MKETRRFRAKLSFMVSALLIAWPVSFLLGAGAYYAFSASKNRNALQFMVFATITVLIISIGAGYITSTSVDKQVSRKVMPADTYRRQGHLILAFFPDSRIPQVLVSALIAAAHTIFFASGIVVLAGFYNTKVPAMIGIILNGVISGCMVLYAVYFAMASRCASIFAHRRKHAPSEEEEEGRSRKPESRKKAEQRNEAGTFDLDEEKEEASKEKKDGKETSEEAEGKKKSREGHSEKQLTEEQKAAARKSAAGVREQMEKKADEDRQAALQKKVDRMKASQKKAEERAAKAGDAAVKKAAGKPEAAEQKAAAPDKAAEVKKTAPAVPEKAEEERKAAPEKKPAAAERKAEALDKPAEVKKTAPAVPEKAEEERKAAPEKRPEAAERKAAAPEKRPEAAERKAAAPEKRPEAAERKAAASEKRPADPEKKVSAENRQAAPAANKKAVKKAALPEETRPVKKQAVKKPVPEEDDLEDLFDEEEVRPAKKKAVRKSRRDDFYDDYDEEEEPAGNRIPVRKKDPNVKKNIGQDVPNFLKNTRKQLREEEEAGEEMDFTFPDDETPSYAADAKTGILPDMEALGLEFEDFDETDSVDDRKEEDEDSGFWNPEENLDDED